MYKRLLEKIALKSLGRAAVDAIIAAEGRITLKRFRKQLRRQKKLHREFEPGKEQLDALHRTCAVHMQKVNSPLALISQIQRSGGSLLSQLFDGHPEVHAHPHELKIGFPSKYTWPRLELADNPRHWLETLFETSVLNHFKNGYKKQRNMDETALFLFLPSVQKELFFKHLQTLADIELRDVFDAYMTSYFGAWLNNQNYFGPKKFVTAFTARLSMNEANMQAFFETYPDGRLISILRDPRNWFPSAAKHKPAVYGDIGQSLNLWCQSAAAMLRNNERYGDKVCVLSFEDLICRTEAVMHYLADYLEIDFDDCLLIPSFNKQPVRPNTSFKDRQHGIIESTLNRYKTLAPKELKIVEEATGELYASVLKICVPVS
jgi:hypothetical protein